LLIFFKKHVTHQILYTSEELEAADLIDNVSNKLRSSLLWCY